MPRYYLHLRELGQLVVDEEGTDLPDLAAAEQRAISGARGVIADEVLHGVLPLSLEIVIEEEGHHTLQTVRFADVARIN